MQSLYKDYVSTHINPRKGPETPETLRARGRTYRAHFGRFLPLNKESRILDVGCGSGALVHWLHRLGYQNSEGIDLSSEQISVGHSLGISSIRVGSLFELSDSKIQYDCIFMRDVLEHFPKSETMRVLQVLRGAIRPGGRLVLQVPNGESPFFGRIRYGDFTHEIAFTRSSLQQILLNSGFYNLTFASAGPVYYSLKSLIRMAIWRLTEWVIKIIMMSDMGSRDAIITQNIIVCADLGAEQALPN